MSKKIKTRAGLARLLAAGSLMAALCVAPAAHGDASEYGFATTSASLSTTQAGAHPDFTLAFELKQDPAGFEDENGVKFPYAKTRDLIIDLPPGLIGNPTGTPKCTTQQLQSAARGAAGVEGFGSICLQDSQVGVTTIFLYAFSHPELVEPVYLMAPPGGDSNVVARLGFVAAFYPVVIDISVRSDSDYGLTAKVEGAPAAAQLIRSSTTIWGVPAASSHDRQRITPLEAKADTEYPPVKSGLTPVPFLSNPTSCGGGREVTFESDSYVIPGLFAKSKVPLPEITGCGKLKFEPKFSLVPTTRSAASPSGVQAELSIPQDETVDGQATSQLRGATVKLPEGMTIASGAADGLQACSASEVGYQVSPPGPAHCPDASKIGTAEIDVPALEHTLQGAVYQRSPEPGNLFRIWLVADELGLHLKLPGEINLNPQTGQVTSVFVDTPQAPVRDFKLNFKGGSHGVLATPSSCGTYLTHYQFTPWSGGVDATGDAPMTIDEGCDTGGFSPKLAAGTANPSAGWFSPFVLNLTRESGEQNLAGLDLSMPRGVVAKLAGVALCPVAQAATGECPTASRIGATTVAAGPGPTPLWIPQPGKDPTAVYLSGPYRGAPYSLVVKTPAQAGPFDLGTVVVRAAIYVDPETAEVSVKSDPLPQFLEGVAVSYRTVHVDVDRPEFTLNPTSCDPMSVDATATSDKGAIAHPSSRFQAAGCDGLGFKPKLSMRLFGKTNRGAHPRFRAVLKPRPGDANIAKAAVTLPHAEFLDQGHIRTVCTRVQYAADQCPTGSIYGHAKAISPLLDRQLEGPVYLRSSSHQLPDLVVALHGQIDIDLAGRIDSVRGGIRTTFEAAPDAPVSKFTITMQGGKKGLLVNSRNLCEAPSFATVKLDGQNGKTADQEPRLNNSCGGRNPGRAR